MVVQVRRLRRRSTVDVVIRDRVTPELVEALWARDLGCVLSFLQAGHVCTNKWGDVIDWQNAGITVEHVKPQLRMGVRARSILAETVLLCAGSNIGVPSKAQRALIRDYIAARRVA